MSATGDDDVRYQRRGRQLHGPKTRTLGNDFGYVVAISVMPAPARAPEAHGVHRGDLERNILDRGA